MEFLGTAVGGILPSEILTGLVYVIIRILAFAGLGLVVVGVTLSGCPIEIAGKFEVYNLEKNIHILAVIAGIAPMFGFLGTIIGVIKIFYNISMTSDVSIGSVSAGLYTKMVSSASGLIVGIVAYIGYHWLNTILNKAVHQLEWNAMNFIDLLKSPSK